LEAEVLVLAFQIQTPTKQAAQESPTQAAAAAEPADSHHISMDPAAEQADT
jgi:hypothetical protein